MLVIETAPFVAYEKVVRTARFVLIAGAAQDLQQVR
jgi:hypothetical protein